MFFSTCLLASQSNRGSSFFEIKPKAKCNHMTEVFKFTLVGNENYCWVSQEVFFNYSLSAELVVAHYWEKTVREVKTGQGRPSMYQMLSYMIGS